MEQLLITLYLFGWERGEEEAYSEISNSVVFYWENPNVEYSLIINESIDGYNTVNYLTINTFPVNDLSYAAIIKQITENPGRDF